ncbi:MAG: (d)CMP kinase [Acidobacteria bacterium]|nr:(d)CMP kinase [Acidobacteriota bacterium]
MVITIDGPAGSGKSTAARKVAARLEVPYLDTGAMYRAITHVALLRGIPLEDEQAVVELARQTRLEVDCGPTHARVRADGHDISEAVRSLKVTQATGAVARIQPVRDLMVAEQRRLGRRLGSFVTEGRDQGSIVFPDADMKFVLEAELEQRALRRLRDLQVDGEEVEFREVIYDLKTRDANDSVQWSSLLRPDAAIVIDTTDLSIAQVVDCLLGHIRAVIPWPNASAQS